LDAYLNPGERKGRSGRDGAERERLRLRAEADIELVQLRSESHKEEMQDWEDRQAAVAEAETHLGELLSRAGVSVRAGNIQAGIEAYEEAFRNHERWQKAQSDLQTAMRWHRALRGVHADAEEEAARLLELDSTLRALGAWQPGWSTVEPDRSADAYAPLLEGVEEKLAAARDEQARLQATLDKQSGSLRHLAEIDEELAAAREEVHRLERFREALQMARQELATASQQYRQQFGPRLELLLYEGLHAIMPGRFSAAAIDPETLAVIVHVPGGGASLPADTLSGSARELIQLLLRLGIARLMSQSMEKLPLLLDEPLVQCDRERQQQAFDYLAQQAENTQILLFTRDERLQARFREKWESSPLHQMLVIE
jgi:DNA repair exonuclease SbcCD ATPase subunit